MTDEGSQRRVKNAGFDRARSLAIVARILMKNDRQKRVSNQVSVNVIQVAGAYTLEETFRPVPIPRVRICEFSETAAYNKGETDGIWVNDGVKGKVKLLPGRQRHRLAVHHYVEQRQNTTHGSLLFLCFYFAFRFIVLFPRLSLRLCFVCGTGSCLRSRLCGSSGCLLRRTGKRRCVRQSVGHLRTFQGCKCRRSLCETGPAYDTRDT